MLTPMWRKHFCNTILCLCLLTGHVPSLAESAATGSNAQEHIAKGQDYRDKQKLFDKAIEEFTAALSEQPDCVEAYYERGKTYLWESDDSKDAGSLLDNAIADYTTAIKLSPQDARFYNNRGNAYNKKKNFESAKRDYDKAIELKPDDSRWYFNRARLNDKLRHFEAAAQDYGKAIELGPKQDVPALYLQRALDYLQNNQKDKALSDSNQAIALDPKLAGAYYIRSLCGNDPIADLTKAIELDPNSVPFYFQRASDYFKIKEFKASVDDLSKTISLAPNDAEAYAMKANALYELARYDESIADFTKAIKLAPANADNYRNRGWSYWMLNKTDEALQDYDKAIELNSSSASNFIARATFYLSRHDFQKAIDDYTRAIALDGELDFAYAKRGAAYVQLKQYKPAVDDLTKVLTKAPDIDSYVSRAIAYAALGDDTSALSDFQKAISLDPKNANTYNERGTYYNDRKKDYEKAIADYTQVIALKPKIWLGYTNRALAYERMHKLDQALTDYTKAIEVDPNTPDRYRRRGSCYSGAHHFEEAIADFSKAISLNKTDASGYHNRGNCYYDAREYEKAIADYTMAISLDANDPQTYMDRSDAYTQLSNFGAALGDLNKAQEHGCDEEKASDKRVDIFHDDLGDPESALLEAKLLKYSQAIERAPENANAYYKRISILEKLGYYDRALADCRKLIEMQPGQAHPFNTQGNIHYFQGLYDQALADFQKAQSMERDSVYLVNQAACLSRLGKPEKALDLANEALKSDPTDSWAYGYRGDAFRKLNQIGRAFDDYDRAVKLGSYNWEANRSRGDLYFERKEYQRAKDDYDAVLRKMPRLPSVYFNRGLCEQNLEDYSSAVHDFQRALDLFTDLGQENQPQFKQAQRELSASQDCLKKREIRVVETKQTGSLGPGHQHALLIATDNYNEFDKLANPTKDADELGRVLHDQYGFDVEPLYNATRSQIMSKIKDYAARDYPPEDQLLIFISGHGACNSFEGYVVPTNAAKEETSGTWIPYGEMEPYLVNSHCKHLLLVLDVCYAGTFMDSVRNRMLLATRDVPDEYQNQKRGLMESLAYNRDIIGRKLLASSSDKPALDGAPDHHSPFASFLLQALKKPGSKDYLSFEDVKLAVTGLKQGSLGGDFGNSDTESQFYFIPTRFPTSKSTPNSSEHISEGPEHATKK